MGKQVWMIGPTPYAPEDMPLYLAIARQAGTPDPAPTLLATHRASSRHFVAALEALQAGSGLVYSDPAPWFCDANACRYTGADGLPLYRDTGHLSVRGALLMVPELQRAAPEFVPGKALR